MVNVLVWQKKLGALQNYKDCIFICLGTGIGGAAFYNGKLIVPERSSGFEFGHMIIQKMVKFVDVAVRAVLKYMAQ